MSPVLMEHDQNLQSGCDFSRLTRYIRVRSKPDARFVEFDFAIGEPSLFVELIMPPAVFKVFCTNNTVVHMSHEQMTSVDAELEKWRYGEDTLMFKNRNRSIA